MTTILIILTVLILEYFYDDIKKLLPCLDWAYDKTLKTLKLAQDFMW
mgnify:CR=1 FL=1